MTKEALYAVCFRFWAWLLLEFLFPILVALSVGFLLGPLLLADSTISASVVAGGELLLLASLFSATTWAEFAHCGRTVGKHLESYALLYLLMTLLFLVLYGFVKVTFHIYESIHRDDAASVTTLVSSCCFSFAVVVVVLGRVVLLRQQINCG